MHWELLKILLDAANGWSDTRWIASEPLHKVKQLVRILSLGTTTYKALTTRMNTFFASCISTLPPPT